MKKILSVLLILLALSVTNAHAKYEEAPPQTSDSLVPASSTFSPWQYSVGNFSISWQGQDLTSAELVSHYLETLLIVVGTHLPALLL